MSRLLYRWGRAAAHHPWRTIAAWIVIAVAVVGLNSAIGGEPSNRFGIPGTEAQRGLDLLDERFPSAGGVSGQVVFADPDGDITDPTAQATIRTALDSIAAGPNVLGVSDPFDPAAPSVSTNGRIAYSTVRYSIDPPGVKEAEAAEAAVEAARSAGLDAELSRSIVRSADEVGGNESLGLLVAVIVLLVAFGSVIAAGIPIGTALFSIFIGLGMIGVLAGATDVPQVSPMLATMIGLGVGIDYALFVVTRHRAFLHDGHTPAEAAARANATSGTAVLFAGTTVVLALAGLYIAGIPAIATMGMASAITVVVAMGAAVSLLPAFLGLAGHRIDRWHVGRRKHTAEATHGADAHPTVAGRWADHVGRHPWRYAIASFVGLAAIAVPVLSMRTGVADDGTADKSHTYRHAYDMLAEGFGPGFNGPLTVVLEGGDRRVEPSTIAATAEALSTTSGIAAVVPPQVSENGTTAVLLAIPATSPQAEATERLVHTLRDETLPAVVGNSDVEAYVTGQTAASIDIAERLSDRLPWFIGAVVLLSFLLLMLVFRSLLVPLKAALMNLLSIGGAYGVVVAVFQWGWGRGLLGLDESVPISPFLPMIMFAILFGLSMDYEVFLLSRVREEFVRTGDSHRSVVDGLAATARVITSAALIMVSVFAAFLLTPDVEVKMFAVGLTVAVALDATVVRMVLVPATMALMGDANWWLPKWLDRLLPHVDVEGSAIAGAGQVAHRPTIVVPDDLSTLDEDELVGAR